MNKTTIDFSAEGSLSKKIIQLTFRESEDKGIFFQFPDSSRIKAEHKYITSTSRNTVLGNEKNQVCFVEHLLSIINILKLDKIVIEINGLEIPLLEGSGKEWFKLLKDWPHKEVLCPVELNETFSVTDSSNPTRAVLFYPSDKFRISYLFKPPYNSENLWVSWSEEDSPENLINARTFAPSFDHEMLGLKGKLLSYDENGFDLPLHSKDEPAWHKLLDFLGDLSLVGINPLSIKGHFISIMGGHGLNAAFTKELSDRLKL
jgi:UDP-3-O-[3-hydroxymyristoyl] N-acetylglucosamine deacetylase